MSAVLRLGTRRSLLARSQSEQVAEALRAASGRAVELVEIVTEGDVNQAPLASLGGVGVFASALRQALLEDRIDLAVHSLKDLPTAPAEGLVLAAIPIRQDPRDVLVTRGGQILSDLGDGARVGTGSPRRAAQLRALGLGLEVVEIRGNVDSRIARVTSGELDGVLLARAGLLRIGRAEEAGEVLDPLQMLPAPGQGALAVECRAGDAETIAACALLDDPATRACVLAERAVLAELEGGCAAPVGALAEYAEGIEEDELYLRAVVAAPDGSADLRRSVTGGVHDPESLGRQLARILLEDGAAELVPALALSHEKSHLPASTSDQLPVEQPVADRKPVVGELS